MSRVRLALFMPSLAGGGAERVMLHLACGLSDREHEVDFVLAKAEGPYLAQVPSSVRVVDLQARQTLASLPGLTRYLRQERPTALLAALEHSNVVSLWARQLAKVPTRIIVSVHNTLTSDTQNAASFKKRLEPVFVKRFYPKADGIVAVSGGVADDLTRMTGIPRDRITVIYNPVISAEMFQKAAQPLTHPWFMPGEPPVLLAVGRLTRQKNFGMLLSAFAQLHTRRPARLLILGEGEERAALEAQIKTLGIAQDASLPGFVENPYSYMKRARAVCMSSRWEGLPTVLIEALACGTPVVSTDCPSGPFEILQGGRYGELVPVGDVEALACALEKTLAQPNRPPEESWKPYLIETATARYRDLMLDGV